MPDVSPRAEERIAYWRSFRKTSLQQFRRSRGEAYRHVLLCLDPRDEFCQHLVKVSYRKALLEEDASPVPDGDLGLMEILGSPYVLVLPLDAAMAALHLVPRAVEALKHQPPTGHVRVAIVRPTAGEGVGCTVITEKALPPRRENAN